MTSTSEDQSVRLIFPPPFIYLAALLAGILVHRRWSRVPVFSQSRVGYLLGTLSVAAGVGLFSWARTTMVKFGEHPDPQAPTNAVVSTGPYRFSRNPYIAFTVVYLGISFIVNTAWPLFLLPGVLAVVHYGVILREERYLDERLGEDYRRYRESVWRWI